MSKYEVVCVDCNLSTHTTRQGFYEAKKKGRYRCRPCTDKAKVKPNTNHVAKNVYATARAKITNPFNDQYHFYGGAGIKMHPAWFEDRREFYKWCDQNGYEKGDRVIRLDSKGDFCPDNCRVRKKLKKENENVK